MRVFLVLFFLSVFILPSRGQNQTEMNNEKAGITFLFPWLNYYHYVDYQKREEAKKFGFFGIGLGVYYKTANAKISFNVSSTDDLASPIAQINYTKTGPQTDIGSSFGELLYQRPIYQNIYFIGGFNFSSYNFHFTSGNDSIRSYIKTDNTLGMTIGLEYRFDNNYSVASIYRPALASFETDSHYRHLITFELRIDIDVWKTKRIN